jgi:predicted transposase YbfD/YdcC
VIGVKKNQQLLHRDIERIMAKEENVNSKYTDIEQNKGRQELRAVSVSNCLDGISKDWVGVAQVVKVLRITKEKKQTRTETAYFISSLRGHATFYNEGIRAHWSIENSLHWVKDVTLEEDASKIRTGHAPENLSTIRNITLNVFRANDYDNMEQAKRLVCNNIELLKNIII